MNNLDFDSLKYQSDYISPIKLVLSDWKTSVEDGIYQMVQSVDIDVDKDELMKALQYDRNQYEQGQWDMFCLIASAYNGKDYYFEQEDGTIYSRKTGKYLSNRDEAYKEFLNEMSN